MPRLCWRAWSALSLLPFLIVLRALVFFNPAARQGAPAGVLHGLAMLFSSLALELAVIAACVGLSYAGRSGRILARVILAALLLANVAGTAFFLRVHTYFRAYLATKISWAGLEEVLVGYVNAPIIAGLLIALTLSVFFDGRVLTTWGPLRRPVAAVMGLILLISCVIVVRRWQDPAAVPITAHSPVLLAFLTRDVTAVPLPTGVPVPSDWGPPQGLAPQWAGLAHVRRDFNVVLVVLESVRADVVWPSPTAVPMPHLAALASSSAVFTRAYAHEPRSRKGLEALMFGIFPSPTWDTLRNSSARIALDSVPERWSHLGLRTAYLQQWDAVWDNAGSLLAHRGIDAFWSEKEMARFQPAGTDEALVNALDSFIGEAPQRQFGAVLWTEVTHGPYRLPAPLKNRHPLGSFGAYRDTVTQTDQTIGQLVSMLKRRGVFEKTVIILVGDHGESFGERPGSGFAHGRRLYEASVHVPLILINPTLFHGERDDRVVQQMDVAATAAWLAGDDRLRLNVGTSVFFQKPAQVAYMVNPMDGYCNAIILDQWKYMWTQSMGDLVPREQLFDLRADPTELHNVLPEHADEGRALRRRLFGWYSVWKGRWRAMNHVENPASPTQVAHAFLGR